MTPDTTQNRQQRRWQLASRGPVRVMQRGRTVSGGRGRGGVRRRGRGRPRPGFRGGRWGQGCHRSGKFPVREPGTGCCRRRRGDRGYPRPLGCCCCCWGGCCCGCKCRLLSHGAFLSLHPSLSECRPAQSPRRSNMTQGGNIIDL